MSVTSLSHTGFQNVVSIISRTAFHVFAIAPVRPGSEIGMTMWHSAQRGSQFIRDLRPLKSVPRVLWIVADVPDVSGCRYGVPLKCGLVTNRCLVRIGTVIWSQFRIIAHSSVWKPTDSYSLRLEAAMRQGSHARQTCCDIHDTVFRQVGAFGDWTSGMAWIPLTCESGCGVGIVSPRTGT